MAIRKRVFKSGSVAFFADFRVNGKRERKLFTTRKQAEAFLIEQKHAVKRGTYVDPRAIPTFRQASDDFFAARQNRSPSTISGLRSRLANLNARLGDKRLDQIDVGMLEALRTDLRKTLKRSTTRLITQSCGEVFKYAMRAGRCLRNPVSLMEREHRGSREIVDGETLEDETDAVSRADVPNRDAVRDLIARAPSGFYKTILSVAAGSGLREGELLALTWGNVELGGIGEPGKIHVRQTLSWARGSEQYQRATFREPKTKAGIRTVPIAPELNAILRAWKLACPPSNRDLVFSNDGLPHRNGKIGLRISKLTATKVRLHALRHYFASEMIATGKATIVEIAKVLGHKDATVTLKVYAHFLNRDDAPTAAITAVANGLFARA